MTSTCKGAVIRDGWHIDLELVSEWEYGPMSRTWHCRLIEAKRIDTGEAVELTDLEQQLFWEELHPSNLKV